ncbi:MAG: C4-dicarboxylate ABC transporter substrate-binding protein [Rhodospirillaceae bacterium]|nr:C4-dicarboxylate ABC transporter substrate-binding protein [Rhodospirillaceae bacterium]
MNWKKFMNDATGATGLKKIDIVFSRLEDACNLLAAITIMALMFMAVYQIAARRLLDAPIFGYIDFIEQMMVIFAFLGIAYCQRMGGHVRMELFISQFRGRSYWLLECFGVLVAWIVIGVLIKSSFEHFLRAWELGDSTINVELPIWPAKLLIPLAFTILWLRLAIQIAGYFRMFMEPDRRPVAITTIKRVEEVADREIREALGQEVQAGSEEADDATR